MKSLKTKIKLILFAAVCMVLGIGIGLLLAPTAVPCQPDTTGSANVRSEQPAEQSVPEAQTAHTETVYWTPNGEVYHLYRSCPSLNHSTVIESGRIEESGKPRVCHNCEGS